MPLSNRSWMVILLAIGLCSCRPLFADVGVGAKPIAGAEMLLDGSREMLDEKWTYWQGPGFKSSLPIKWKIVDDPVDDGKAVMTDDPAAAGGRFGAADIVTKREYRDFRLHVEFLIVNAGGNSGVYLQNRHEIQVLDGDKTKHGMGAVINESESPYHAYNGLGHWNAYDIVFRAARFTNGQRTEKARVTMYFNGQKVHKNFEINQVWGGPNSGIDGGNDGGKGITDTPGGIKLQCEGHDVRYRNTWIKKLDLKDANTDFDEPLALLTSIPKTENIHMLFDGEHFDEWNVDPERWRLVDGMIQGKVLQQKQMYSYIFTQKGYRNFRLLLEVKQLYYYKAPYYHSGVVVLGKKFAKETGVTPALWSPAVLFCSNWGLFDTSNHQAVPRDKGLTVDRPGEWNQIEIVAKINRIRCAANGTELFDHYLDAANQEESPIGLMISPSDNPQEFLFRHIVLSDNPSDALVTVKKKR